MGLKVYKQEGTANEESIELTYEFLDDAYVLETQIAGTGLHKDILIKTEGNIMLRIKADGTLQILPGADNVVELGSPSFRFKNINSVLINGI